MPIGVRGHVFDSMESLNGRIHQGAFDHQHHRLTQPIFERISSVLKNKWDFKHFLD